MGFRVLGFAVLGGLGFGVRVQGFRISDSRFGVWGLGCRALQGLGTCSKRVSGLTDGLPLEV